MIDINKLRENPAFYQKASRDKGMEIDIDKILALDKKVKNLRLKIEDLRRRQNAAAREKNIEVGKKLKVELDHLKNEATKIESELNQLLVQIPNPAAADVKVGKNESDNEIIRKWGEVRKLDFQPLDHLAIGKKLNIIDTERAAKVSGSRFVYLKGKGALLEMALIQFAVTKLVEKGFEMVVPPVLISAKSMAGMGYLEHGGADDMYYLEKDDLYLVGTSEQAIGPMHQDEIIEEKNLPLKYAGFSTCFRREAGSYGKDTKGILRLHQFDKVEMFVFCQAQESDKMHEYLLSVEEELMQALEIPYRVVKMCTADLGAPAARKYDIEAWMAGQNQYRETHSTSTTTDFQSRRLNIKTRRKDGKTEFVHLLNGTAFSMRPLICILENNQTKDGKILVPKVLQKYCGFEEI